MNSSEGAHTARLHLPARQPFGWRHSLAFIAGFPATRGEQVIEGDHLVEAWRVAGCSVATRVGPEGDGLSVEVASQHPVDAVLRETVADRIAFHLSLDDDLSPLVQDADEHFAVVEQGLHGYHQVKFPSPVEHLVWAVLSQRTPLPVAREAKHRLAAAVNDPLTAFGHPLQPFPSLDELAELAEGELAELVRNQRKASFLHGMLPRLARAGEPFLREAPIEEVEQFLLSLPGIGPWSATFVLIRGLGRMSLLPQDAELLRSAGAVYGHPVDADEAVALAERYAPLQGYWAHYLRASA